MSALNTLHYAKNLTEKNLNGLSVSQQKAAIRLRKVPASHRDERGYRVVYRITGRAYGGMIAALPCSTSTAPTTRAIRRALLRLLPAYERQLDRIVGPAPLLRRSLQQLRQLGGCSVQSGAPRSRVSSSPSSIARTGARPPPVGVAHDETRGGFLEGPGRGGVAS